MKKSTIVIGLIIWAIIAYLYISKNQTPMVEIDDSVFTGEVLTGEVLTGVVITEENILEVSE